ncbi:hypothetical protein SD78_4419 [Bacillus badius]|nr:hypothetical protein SD78_4419 [Bacillus badius]
MAGAACFFCCTEQKEGGPKDRLAETLQAAGKCGSLEGHWF